jgi:erythronate-4-phosphate dehydrogenase
MLNLIVDENIAFARDAFMQFGNVTLLPGREINNAVLHNTDILIVRSITNVNEELLKNTPVKFVGTATIGTDHINLDYLKINNITFADAKGCNAFSVAEYVMAALFNLAVKFDFSLKDKSIGIVGVGNVGSKVAGFAEALGMKVLLNDPPLQRNGNTRKFVDLNEIFSADIITLHVPLNLNGIDKTFHLIDKEKLSRIKDKAILINTSRGAVVNNIDLHDAIDKKNLKVVLDVWENEPTVDIELVNEVHIGTPHIAGYSLEGKINGTQMIYNSLCEFLNAQKTFSFDNDPPINSNKLFGMNYKIELSLEKLISGIYSIQEDDKRMREMLNMNIEERIKYFDSLRKNYPIRREFNNYSVKSTNLSEEVKSILEKLRFNITT